jgi:hypothetical protein
MQADKAETIQVVKFSTCNEHAVIRNGNSGNSVYFMTSVNS